MKLTPDDPKLTAYALGELDKSEAEQIEREVQNNPELRQAIAEVRETAALLKRELSDEPTLSLTEMQKSDVLAKTKPDNIIPFPRQRIFKIIGIGAIAASLAFVLARQFGQDSKRATIAPHTNSEFRYAQNAISQQKKAAEEKTASESATPPTTPNPSVKSGAGELSLIQKNEALKSPAPTATPKPGENHGSYRVAAARNNSAKESQSLESLAQATSETLGDSTSLDAVKPVEEPVALAFSAGDKATIDSKQQAPHGVVTVNRNVTSAGSTAANQPAQQFFYNYGDSGFKNDDLYAK
ncbi:MAG: hypothetical protein ABJC04_11750 [Verrucomicrobiota bacterium]